MTLQKRFKRVLVTGGAGYVGSVLVPQLLSQGYEVVVYDTMYFGGDGLPKNPALTVIEGDIRDAAHVREAANGCDAVIHMACISNDPSFELNEGLSKSINFDCFEDLVLATKAAGAKRFIYASSSSVYGVSDAPDVTEEHPLVPLTLYNKFKGMCEPILFKHQSTDFTCVAIRPATICGYGPRMRLDLSVNILTAHAVMNRKITVFGGSQMRPNLHINDMADVYSLLLEAPNDKIAGEIFNAGYQNLSIMQIAQIAKQVVESEFPNQGSVDIVTTPSDDLRSYHVNSDKIRRVLGYAPKRTVEDAIRDVCAAFKAGRLPNSMSDERYYNVRTMKNQKIA
ncbi:NAD-dependent epimerase/dehydratase family protein [Undibacter mobilis]|uniref:SDR family NAD-dependent epimerase/dehydratase n=1 Tax=Undibacter mobilis TaxID=2292256 RepID=A0A371B6T8_9BRAD|nr:SDR family oxidoreductase [Undibacter mobilis]RDV03163.1 SDR family NAD-dependent epimerase/dehydratase [Undibacter mobilis]